MLGLLGVCFLSEVVMSIVLGGDRGLRGEEGLVETRNPIKGSLGAVKNGWFAWIHVKRECSPLTRRAKNILHRVGV